MLTKLTIRNFKRFDEAVIELGDSVVLIGPNNSGKTSTLQALSLWELGLRRWTEKKKGREKTTKKLGVVINRRDLFSVAAPNTNHLWRDLHVREMTREAGAAKVTNNIRIEIVVDGVDHDRPWTCGLEFDFANRESFHCRPLRLGEGKDQPRMAIPSAAERVRVAFLPPMSGLVDREFKKQPGELGYLIGQGRTAEVLRNLCWRVYEEQAFDTWADDEHRPWGVLVDKMKRLFGIALQDPLFVQERSEIEIRYKDQSGVILDISAAGRGVQQTLLLLAYLAANPHSVLLLDEPDAHLEILRQRQIYRVLTESAREQRSQIIAASHSEVVLNEAAGRDVVVAFVGRPHRIDNRSQVRKALTDIGFEDYYQAEQRGWVLYLEGSTDLNIIQNMAKKLGHAANEALEAPFVHYVENQPMKAVEHFAGLKEARPGLRGIGIFDRLEKNLPTGPVGLTLRMWERREIENYICTVPALLAFARASASDRSPGPLFDQTVNDDVEVMQECIDLLVPRLALDNPGDRWWHDTKVSTDFLDRLFETYYERLKIPNLMRKANYHLLTEFVDANQLDPLVVTILSDIYSVSRG